MKKINFSKVGVIFSLLLFLYSNLNAQEYILSDDGLIDPRAKEKINQIGAEVKSKLGVNVYIYAKSNLGLEENIKTKDKIDYIKQNESQIFNCCPNEILISNFNFQNATTAHMARATPPEIYDTRQKGINTHAATPKNPTNDFSHACN